MNAIEVAQRFVKALDAHDVYAIVAAFAFAKERTYHNPDTGQALTGNAIATFAKSVWVAFPDFSTELISIGESGGGLVTYRWVMRGTNTGPGQTELCDLNRDMSHTRLDSVENRKLYIL